MQIFTEKFHVVPPFDISPELLYNNFNRSKYSLLYDGGNMYTKYLPRKESIILTAIEIIGDLGIQGLSSKEIAARQGISEGTLFRHFTSKNEIIVAVLDKFSQFDSDIFSSAKLKSTGFKEAINYFFNAYVEYYENYPAITSIVNAYEGFRWDSELESKLRGILQRRYNFIECLIDEGKKNGELGTDIESRNLADVYIGFFNSITLNWRMSQYGFSLKERMFSTLDMVTEAFLQH